MVVCGFFFFKQKTAYEISACLVGSEMCIRDRITVGKKIFSNDVSIINDGIHKGDNSVFYSINSSCLLYTSDAADEEDSVDLGGRRIIKKKKPTIRAPQCQYTKNDNTHECSNTNSIQYYALL